LDWAYIHILLLMGEADSSDGKTNDAEYDEKNSYDCGCFHERLFIVRCNLSPSSSEPGEVFCISL